MTNVPFQDSVAIDTNVFRHLLNPQNNVDNHINALLVLLETRGIALLVDMQDYIPKEYERRIIPWIERADDTRIEKYILYYWMEISPRITVSLIQDDDLMAAIGKVIVEDSEFIDRVFVYVAFKQGKVLISNDLRDIVLGTTLERRGVHRRFQLLGDTTELRPPGADILTSEEAYDKIQEH